MEFIACDPLVTTPLDPALKCAGTVGDLIAEMSRLRIGAAMVRHLACEQAGPCSGNRILMQETACNDGLLPVWSLTPDGAPPGFDCVATVRQMLDEGVRAAWMTPDVHDYSPAPWCCGELYDVLGPRGSRLWSTTPASAPTPSTPSATSSRTYGLSF